VTNLKHNFRWAYLEIRTSQKAKDEDQAYGAGYLEGTLTADLIYSYWSNTAKGYCTDRPKICQQLKDYMTTNKNWIKSRSDDSDSYWYQVCYLFFNHLSVSPYILNDYFVTQYYIGRTVLQTTWWVARRLHARQVTRNAWFDFGRFIVSLSLFSYVINYNWYIIMP